MLRISRMSILWISIIRPSPPGPISAPHGLRPVASKPSARPGRSTVGAVRNDATHVSASTSARVSSITVDDGCDVAGRGTVAASGGEPVDVPVHASASEASAAPILHPMHPMG
jgi:hypothetical protein